MGFEIDFHPVGDGERSGDAISLRFGDLKSDPPKQTVVVIDGGYTKSGETLIEHIKRYYKTNRVNIVVSTHPDADHSAGLAVVLEQLEVGQLVMHQPWNHTEDIAKMFKDDRVTDASVRAALRESLDNARDLERIARRRGVQIVEPFAGMATGDESILVVGPDEKYYESLLPGFRGTPEAADGLAAALAELFKGLKEGAKEAVTKVRELWDLETLTDAGTTSAENNSSAIILVRVAPEKYALFTGDAGMPALTMASDYLDSRSFNFSKLDFVQVPHHGGQDNVGPTILDRLIGPKLQTEARIKTAFVSAAADDKAKHPYKKVMNAFRRRGAPVHATQGTTKRHSEDAPDRAGWVASVALPLYNDVED